MMSVKQRPAVLFVLPWSLRAIGGVNQVVTHLAQHMRDAGEFEPLVLMADWDAAEPVYEEIHGLRTVRWQVRPYQDGMGLKARLGYAAWEWRFRKRFARFCREHAVGAINLHYPGGMAFTFKRVLPSIAPRIPLLLSFHGTDASNLVGLGTAEKQAWRQLLGKTDAVVTCSQELARRIEGALATPVAHHVIYNGVNADTFAARTAPALASVILHVGKFDHNKGQDVLVDAFARIADAFPGTMLHLVGGSGSHLERVWEQVARLGMAERVRFFTDIPFADIPAYFAEASVFALPSRQEAFPLVLLEAGASSLPVVASRVGGIPELIRERETGLLVEPDDAAAMAQALRTLLDDQTLARRLGQCLAERVASDYSWTSTRLRYEQLIRDAGGRAGAAA
jgi:glycosyltransferase involved in cell wall biosynthesis